MNQTKTSTPQNWPSVDGEAATIIRNRDWSETSLGPIKDWPQSLRSSLEVGLSLDIPAAVCWGEDLLFFCNDSWLEVMGKRYVSRIGRPTDEIISSFSQSFGEYLQQVYTTGKTEESRCAVSTINGLEQPGENSFKFNPLHLQDGTVGGVLVLAHLTDRELQDNQLHADKRHMNMLLDASAIGTWEWEIETNNVEWSEKLEAIHGLEPGEFNGSFDGFINAIHPDDRENVISAIQQALKGDAPYSIDHRWVREDGQVIWLEGRGQVIYDENGKATGMMGTCMDITDRKKAEQAFQEREHYLSALVQTTPECIKVVDSDGTLLEINPAGLNMVGTENTSEVIGNSVYNLIVPEHREMFKEFNERVCKGESGTLQYDIIDLDGNRRNMETHAAPLNRPDGTVAHLGLTRDVTVQKRAEEELKKVTFESDRQKRLYEAVLSSTPDLVYVFDLNYRFTYANDALLQMWGRSLEESLGKSLLEIGYEPWHAEMHERELDEVIATRQPVRGEVPFQHASLGERIYDYIFVPVLNANGEVEAVAGTTRDITEHKMAESALRESEEKYRTLFKSIDEGFCIIEVLFDKNDQPVDYRFVETNPSFEKHTDISDAEGKSMRQIAPDHEKHWFDIYGKVALTGEPARFESYANFMKRWYSVYAFQTGKPDERKVAVLFNDVTERKKAQEERERLLREVETERERLADIFQHAPSFMAILRGPEHVFERANNLYHEIAGKRELIGKPVREVFPEVEGQGYFELLDHVYQTGEPYTGSDMQFVLEHEDGPEVFYLDFVYQPLYDSNGSVTGIFVQGVDMTGRKQAKEELQKINETLEERVEERTAALMSYQQQLRSLAAKLSRAEENERQRLATELHDNLGQILTMCKMRLDLLQRDKLPDRAASGTAELTELMDEAIRYTRELMSDLKPPPSLDKADLSSAMDWVADKMKKHGLYVNIEDDGEPKPLSEEIRSTLLQSVRELLFNVVKHAEVDKARVMVERENNHVKVTVEDQGKGFNMQGKKPKPTREGGFGLFSIRERIDILGGTMKVVSKRGEGTTVVLLAPLKREKSRSNNLESDYMQEKVPAQPSVTSESGQRIKVLLADDHQMVRTGLRKIIEEEDDLVVIAEASDGREAVRLVQETKPDVVVMDVNMPVMNGIDAARQITAESPATRVIGLSLHNQDSVAQAMRNAGASAYLTKAEVYETLCATIRSEAMVQKD